MKRSSELFSSITNLLKESRSRKSSTENVTENIITLRSFDLNDLPRFLVELDVFSSKIDEILASSYQSQRCEE